jgi:hypothetical protein
MDEFLNVTAPSIGRKEFDAQQHVQLPPVERMTTAAPRMRGATAVEQTMREDLTNMPELLEEREILAKQTLRLEGEENYMVEICVSRRFYSFVGKTITLFLECSW